MKLGADAEDSNRLSYSFFPRHKSASIVIDGISYNLPLYHASMGPDAIGIENLYKDLGILAYDPGFNSTASCSSNITYVDGEAGKLVYRGFSVETLIANNRDYIDVCCLLLNDSMPSKKIKQNLLNTIKHNYIYYSEILYILDNFSDLKTHPMIILSVVFNLLNTFFDDKADSFDDYYNNLAGFSLAQISIVIAAIYRQNKGLKIVKFNGSIDYIENFLHMMFDGMNDNFFMSKEVIRSFDVLLLLHADHEQNASTSVARMVTSTQASALSAISAAISALGGKSHGGANEDVINMLKKIRSKKNIDKFLDKVKNGDSENRLMGFGHRVYRNFDPRAKIIKQKCYDILNMKQIQGEQREMFDIAQELEMRALNDDYFIERNLYPNVDFYSGILLNALGITRQMFTCIFALSRVIGWIAQIKEATDEESIKILRPRQLYKGRRPRKI